MKAMSAVLRGNALSLPIRDASVDLIVTSPPYFGLRSYQDGGEHYSGQIGDEATPAEFVDALIAATREAVRVLKPSGSLWVNLGDKYAGSAGGGAPSAKSGLRGNGHAGGGPKQQAGAGRAVGRVVTGAPKKSLVGIPWRYALRCIDDLGLILRAEIVWSKPNGLPETVNDRVRRSHETWFHFTTRPRYFANMDAVKEPSQTARKQTARAEQLAAEHGLTEDHRTALKARGLGDVGRGATTQTGTGKNTDEVLRLAAEADAALGGYAREFLLGSRKLPNSVRTVPTQPLIIPAWVGVDHYAAFPMEWPRWIIAGWCPERGTVLDPFGGTGTTALMARTMGRTGISLDMSADYCRAARWRTTDPKERAKARRKVEEATRAGQP